MPPGDGSGAFFFFFTKALEPHLWKEQPAQDRQGTTALEMSDMGCQALMGCPEPRRRGPSGQGSRNAEGLECWTTESELESLGIGVGWRPG